MTVSKPHSTSLSNDAQLRRSLLTIEQKFLQAVVEGSPSLMSFNNEFASLKQQIAAGWKSSSLDDETVSLACAMSENIAILGQGFLDFETASSECNSRLLLEWQEMLQTGIGCSWQKPETNKDRSALQNRPLLQSHHAPKPSLQALRHPTRTPIISALSPFLPSRTPSAAISITESSRSASDPNPLPEFIEHAYKFFVTHIFNPYPTRAQKEAIVAQTNNARVTFSSISNWFTNARRRCGWTTILKERCDGNREQLIALATRVFVTPDPSDPVDLAVVQELMEMKEAVETMYERKTRTSAWMEDLDKFEASLHLSSGASTEKQRILTEERRREQDTQKDHEFERQKRKMQVEALGKADKVAKMMERAQEQRKKREQHSTSFVMSYPPSQQFSDEDSAPEPIAVAGGKRKFVTEDQDAYRFPDPRQISSLSSRSSSFISDVSSEDRVPSLTWSDSGDERPYKRTRSSPTAPSSYCDSPRLSPFLDVPESFHYPFTFEPPEGLSSDPTAFGTLFDFSVAPCETLMTRGKKRSHDHEENEESTPLVKRRRSSQPIIASDGPDLASLPPSSLPSSPPGPSTPLFTPRASFDATPTQAPRKRSLHLPTLDAVLGLDLTQPPQVQIAPPDASVPLDVGVFNWSTELEVFGGANAEDPSMDYSQLLQLFGNGEYQTTGEYLPLDLSSASFPPPGSSHQHHPEDLSGLMSGLMSEEALQDMGMEFVASLSATPNMSRESSMAPTVPYVDPMVPTLPAQSSPTPAELAEKAIRRERKRKALEEKRAALERERAQLAEMERELEED